MALFRNRPLSLRGGIFLFICLLAQPRTGRAENGIAYKYADYRESGGRIAIETQGAQIDWDVTPDWHLKLGGILDTIAGATPTGEPVTDGSGQVPLSQMDDRRKAWDATVARQAGRFNVALGYANSRESDYVSNGLSLNTLTDFNQKNTTLRVGLAGSDDDVRVFYQSDWEKKRSRDLLVGVTQLLDPRTSVTVNVAWGRTTGYLSDPYKLVLKNTEFIPGVFLPITYSENRPRSREKAILFASVNRAVPALHGALEASYRFYRDTFGVDAHTLELLWLQRIGPKFILQPSLRLYRQGAANFYYYDLNATAIVPKFGAPNRAGPFYSSDFRLSELDTRTLGLKAIYQVTESIELDVAYERYEMRGRDGITPRSAYPDADIVTAGLKYSW